MSKTQKYVLHKKSDGNVDVVEIYQQHDAVGGLLPTQKASNTSHLEQSVEVLELLAGAPSKDHLESAYQQFPSHCLPSSIEEVVDSVQRKIQCPYELAVQGVLGAISAAYSTQWDVETIGEQVVPVTLAQLACAISGDRKSSTDDEVNKGVISGLRRYNDNLPQDAERAVIFTSNTTVEGMAQQLQSSPVMFVKTADAALFFHSHSMQKEKSDETIAQFADAWSGYGISQIRRGGNRIIERPRFGFNLMTQEDYFLSFITNPRFNQQGIVARTLYLITKSLQGMRTIDKEDYLNGGWKARDAIIQRFHTKTDGVIFEGLNSFARGEGRKVLRPDEEAVDVLVDLYNRWETELIHDDLRGDPWCQRRLEHTSRIAALFDLFEENDYLTSHNLCEAAKLVDFYLSTYLRIKGFGTKSTSERKAETLFEWLRCHPHARDSRSIQQSTKKFGRASDIRRLIAELEDLGKLEVTSHSSQTTVVFSLIET